MTSSENGPHTPGTSTPAVASTSGRRISARIAGIAESATLAVDSKAKALKAAGRPVIGFGAGEPDFPTPDYIVQAALDAARDTRNHRYTPAAGLPELRSAIAAKTARDSGYQVEASQVLVTNGGKQAVFEAFAVLLDPGDEVLLPAPYWTTYPEAITLAGGVPVPVVTDESQGYLATIEQLDAARTPRTKVLLMCSPSNPTGAVYSPEQIREIGRWAYENGLWVVTDEIYEHLTYDGVRSASIPVEVPELADRCLVLNGVAKTYAMTGWRVGWLIGPPDVVKAATNFHSHLTGNVCNIAQRAALAAVSGDLSAVEQMRQAFDRRRRTIVELLSEVPGFTCPTPKGAFYAFPSVKGALGRVIRGRRPTTSAELAELILDEVEVAAVPGEAFGTPGYLRFSYALSDEDLVEGVTRVQKLLAEASS
ncbi:pyridoxal phosphate-dependent aminotransferase [Thermasporomyces composti]|jgi:aspartate/methionine/tyrosine aminotransferase|uniref:Aminotransferase n=1 Tax=Thermasporomyces composti TaxID=696763 RepID=A0A3D9VAV8_THECX|nr:pyridoxal phosphate-dependent aminotransferase [Thermasporomyces composti]REF37290.1 L-aspartate aminotransferase [Thermasporomyces composti]